MWVPVCISVVGVFRKLEPLPLGTLKTIKYRRIQCTRRKLLNFPHLRLTWERGKLKLHTQKDITNHRTSTYSFSSGHAQIQMSIFSGILRTFKTTGSAFPRSNEFVYINFQENLTNVQNNQTQMKMEHTSFDQLEDSFIFYLPSNELEKHSKWNGTHSKQYHEPPNV